MYFKFDVETDAALKIEIVPIPCLALLSYQRWKRKYWFDVVQRFKFQWWHTQRCFNVDLTLPDVILT